MKKYKFYINEKYLNCINFQPGEILITLSTDIAWSPYFPILGGVVTEIGGLISHGKTLTPLICYLYKLQDRMHIEVKYFEVYFRRIQDKLICLVDIS